MSKNDFFTISFTKDKLQIVYLNNTSLKNIRTLASVNLPEGTIADYKVASKQILGDLIKKSIKEVGIQEDQVALVIPEFSTYTKLIELPDLKSEEISEAIKWQVKDYLPSATNEMVVDWRAVGEVGSATQYLVVAIDKDLLYGYIDAVILSGLTPVAVETQALSLVRVTDGQEASKLVIYKNFGEVILVLSEGWKVRGSSVVPLEDSEAVMNTIRRMLQHYSKFKVEKIVVAGKGFDPNFYKKLEEETDVKPEGVSPNVTGLSNEEYNDYLIPVSLQLTTPEDPAKGSSINLLPPVFYESRQEKDVGFKMSFLLGLSALVLFICLILSISFYYIIEKQITSNTLANETIPPNSQEVVDRVTETNNLAKKILSIYEVRKEPQDVINPINNAKPDEISINTYRVDLDKGTVIISGTSQSREGLIAFKTNLESTGDFEGITIPVNSLEQETNISFDMSFNYLPIKPKKQPKLNI